MNTFRSVIFWMHLFAGLAAGVVVLIMSITGVALTYEKQMLEWAAPTAVTLRANPGAPATVTFEGNKSLLVDPYTGTLIGEPPAGLRGFFRSMTVWHRYLALEGANLACLPRRATSTGTTSSGSGPPFHWPSSLPVRYRFHIHGRAIWSIASSVKSPPLLRRRRRGPPDLLAPRVPAAAHLTNRAIGPRSRSPA